MRLGIDPIDEVRVYDPGYEDGQADIRLPRSLLASLGINEDQPIRLRVQDENPRQVQVLGQASAVEPDDPYAITAMPDPSNDADSPPRFDFRFPRAWKDKHWRQDPEDMNDFGDDPYGPIELDYDLKVAQSFLKPDGTLVIPL